jgi:hypothetical protein
MALQCSRRVLRLFGSLSPDLMFPDWNTITIPPEFTTPEAQAFYVGLVFGCIARGVRASIRWFERAADDRGATGD